MARKITAFVLLFILLYNPPIFGLQLTYPVYLLGIAYFIFAKKRINRTQGELLLLGGIVVCIGTVVTLLNGAGDFNMMGFSRLFTSFFCSLLIVDLLKTGSREFNEYTILEWIGYAALVQVAIILSAFFIPSFHSFLLTLCGGGDYYSEKLGALSAFRGIGWTFAQYSDFAICQGIALLCLITVWSSRNPSRTKHKILRGIALTAMIISGILVARTFQLIIFLAFLLWAAILLRTKGSAVLLKNLAIGAVLLVVAVIAAVHMLSDYISEDTLEWAFEIYQNFGDTGKLESASTDELKDFWFLPENINTLLFGDGRYVGLHNHPTYAQSDVGYINSIYYWGIIGSFFYYYSICKSYSLCIRSTRSIVIKYLCITILATILLYNAKGVANGFPYACLILHGLMASHTYARPGPDCEMKIGPKTN